MPARKVTATYVFVLVLLMASCLLYASRSCAEDARRAMPGERDSPAAAVLAPSDEDRPSLQATDTTFLTSIVLENGNTVEFWELSDGAILVAEGGRYPAAPSLRDLVTNAADVLEIYRRVSPPEALVPEQLARAAQREAWLQAQAHAANEPVVQDLVSPSGSAVRRMLTGSTGTLGSVDTSQCPWSWFDNQFSLVTQGPADPDNWSYEQRTGTSWYLNGRMSIVLASACAYRGTVRFNFWSKPTNQIVWTDEPTFTRNVHAGEWYWVLSRAEWWWQYARDIYSEVVYADGDGYHHKGVGCDRKAFSQCAVMAPDGHGYWGE